MSGLALAMVTLLQRYELFLNTQRKNRREPWVGPRRSVYGA